MIDTLLLARLANAWRKQAADAKDRNEAVTLNRCADQLKALVTRQAIEVTSRPVAVEKAS